MSYNPNKSAAVPVSFVSAYSPKTSITLICPTLSPVTKQEFKSECDINTIMRRYQSNGQLPALNQSAPRYLDVTGADFQESMQLVAGAQSLFNELPSSLRNRFKNDPSQFLDFCSDEKNRPEMEKLGLLRQNIDTTIPVPAAASAAASAAAPAAASVTEI